MENNPAGLDHLAAALNFATAMQNKLDSPAIQSSGFTEHSPPVRRRITGLKGIQKDHAKLELEFQKEAYQLERRYLEKFAPQYEKRAKIVQGELEPTDIEVRAGMNEEKDQNVDNTDQKEDASTEEMKGIPKFWLTAMKNHPSLAELITDRDEEALCSLTDIRIEYLDQPGYRLIFEFAPNDFFTNKNVLKTYFYKESDDDLGLIYDHAEGDTINWKTRKDLTVRIQSKKRRTKNAPQTTTMSKTIPVESFFNFFSPPVTPDDGDFIEKVELDYQLGEYFKGKLVPRAIFWFTGETLDSSEYDSDGDTGSDSENEVESY